MPTKGLTVALLLWAAGARAGDEAAVRPCSEVRDAEARASEEVARCTPYTPPMYLRLMLGGGAVPYVNGAFGELTFDASYSSFSGNQARGGAFSSGVSISLAGAFDQRWVMVVAGLFIEIDLTYILFSGFWAHEPKNLPVRFSVGTRLGAAITQSYPSKNDAPYADPYLLARPELHTFADLAIPFGKWRRWALTLRGAIDTPVAMNSVFRYSMSVGLSRGWTNE